MVDSLETNFYKNMRKQERTEVGPVHLLNSMILRCSSVAIHAYYTFADIFSSFSLSKKTAFSHSCKPHDWGAGGEDDGNRLQ